MRYEKYKVTDLSWLKEVPDHWEIRRIASIFEQRKERNNPIKTKEVLSLSAKYGVSLYLERKEKGGNKPKEDISNYNICHEGDILVNCMNVVAGAVGLSPYYGAISPVYYALKTIDEQSDKRYMEYVFRDYNFQRSMVGMGKGIQMSENEDGRLFTVRMRISYDTLKVQVVPIPPLFEQEKIVDFLDWKVNEINRLILIEKEKIKETIKLKKVSVSEILLRRNKDSGGVYDCGYSWIGDVPNDYKVVSLKHLCTQITDGTHSTPTYTSEGIPFLRVTDLSTLDYGENIDLEKVAYISEEEHKELIKRCNPQKGDVLVSKNGTIGIPKVIDWDWDFSIFVSLCLLKLKETVLPEWIYFYFKSDLSEREIAYGGKKGTIVNLHLEKIKEFKIPIPPLERQRLIIKEIEEKIVIIEHMERTSTNIVENLEKLKNSLISEVVTGKINIQDIEIPEYDPVEVEIDEDLENTDVNTEEGEEEWD